MKNIINNLKFISFAILIGSLISCDAILDDSVTDYGTGPDFVGFDKASVTAPFVVKAGESTSYEYNIPLSLDGPNAEYAQGEITVTFEVDPSSTAEAGVNYELTGGNTATLNSSNNFSAMIPVTVYTEGVEPPTVESLVLKITDVSISGGAGNVVVNEKNESTTVNLSYVCAADLTGTYTITNSACSPASPYNETTIEPDGSGGWLIARADGALLQGCTSNTSLEQPAHIIVVCGEVEVTEQPSFCDGYGIGCISGGTWDEENGVLTLQLNDAFFGVGDYTATYTRQ